MNTDDYYRQSQQSLNVSEQNVSTSSQQYLPSMQQDTISHHPSVQQTPQPQIVKTPYQDPKQDPNYASRLAALPAYRHAPDYDTVMQHKMSQMQQQVHTTQQIHDVNQNLAHSHIYAQSAEEGLAYSQPEIRHSVPAYSPETNFTMGTPMRNYANSVSMYTNLFQETNDYMQYRMGDRQTNLVMQPTYSSPELNTHTLPPEFSHDHYLTVNEAFAMQHYKPPPPYPRGSNSTPDLAVQTINSNVSNSPDLISRKTLGDAAFINQSPSDRSIENIAQVIPEVVTISEEPETLQVNTPEIRASPNEQDAQNDDASSDHSNTTFLVKETDSETEETFIRSAPQRQSSRSKVLVRFVAPNKVPPQSASKDVVTRRESFRRMMIARSGSFTPGVLKEQPRLLNINRSLREKEKNSIDEHIQEVNRGSPTVPPRKLTNNIDNEVNTNVDNEANSNQVQNETKHVSESVTQQPVISHDSSVISHNSSASESFDISRVVPAPGREVIRSQSDATKQTDNKVEVKHEKAVSVDSSQERQQLLDKLKSVEMDVPYTISEHTLFSASQENLVMEDSDSESDKVSCVWMVTEMSQITWKRVFWDFRPGKTQTGLLSYRD